jgi:hypothetical protein
MDGFSSFFAVSKTEYNEWKGTVLCLAITGYNKGSVDNLMTQKVIADTVHSVVGDVSALAFWLSIPDAMTLLGNHLVICLWWMAMPTYLLSVHY